MGDSETPDRRAQAEAAKDQPATKPKDPVNPCAKCTVTIAPKPIKTCDTTTEHELTATGDPAGGTFAWKSEDTSIATVSGSGQKVKVKGKKQGKTKVKVTYSAAGCTCSDDVEVHVCTCTSGRKYAFGYKNVAKVIGVRAKIKTRYGKVCCENEGCSTATGYHVVYANISNDAGGLIWAQSGFGRERNAGSSAINQYRYAEMNGATYKVNYDTANAPAEGSKHTYQCQLDKSTGKWSFEFDGAEWQTYADASWKNKTGTSIQYTGEIFNSEDDMPGTSGDKCEITECQYLLEPDKEIKEAAKPEAVLEDFDFDRHDVKPEHQKQLDAVAKKVDASQKTGEPVVEIRIVGHTDPVGSAGYNIGLGQKRATAVSRALKLTLDKESAGLSGKVKIKTESKGESELLDKSGTPAGNARNRRAEIFLSTKVPLVYRDAGLVAGDVRSDDAAEWGAEFVSATALNIWDKKPLP